MTFSPGKRTRLERVSNQESIIAAVAIDRSALRKLLAKAKGFAPTDIPGRMLEEFKEGVHRVLTPHASAILLDPESCDRQASSRDRISPGRGESRCRSDPGAGSQTKSYSEKTVGVGRSDMTGINRREWLGSVVAAIAAGALSEATRVGAQVKSPEGAGKMKLDLSEFQPKSMLHVPETKVSRARFPVIDIHTHLSFRAKSVNGVGLGEKVEFLAAPETVLPIMDRKNVRIMVNLTGSSGSGLNEAIERFQKPHPDRFVTFTEPRWDQSGLPEYGKIQADAIERAKQAGARGLKVLKTLGLYLREKITEGPLVNIDDRRFDPMWEACGSLKMPVAIHVSDPEAFYLPTDRFNERFEELNNHPDWSFHGRDFPSNAELLEARNRVLARHRNTHFILLHVGNDAENLPYVSECLDRFPNASVELGARIGELGRQPRTSRKFFDQYQDRILFGTDAVPNGTDTPQQVFVDALYEIYYRFLETEDEYFDYAPAAVPPQGRWRIYGIGLPENILRKVYYENAARLLQLTA